MQATRSSTTPTQSLLAQHPLTPDKRLESLCFITIIVGIVAFLSIYAWSQMRASDDVKLLNVYTDEGPSKLYRAKHWWYDGDSLHINNADGRHITIEAPTRVWQLDTRTPR